MKQLVHCVHPMYTIHNVYTPNTSIHIYIIKHNQKSIIIWRKQHRSSNKKTYKNNNNDAFNDADNCYLIVIKNILIFFFAKKFLIKRFLLWKSMVSS